MNCSSLLDRAWQMGNPLRLWRTSMFFPPCAALNAAWNSQAYASREQLLMPCGICLSAFKKPKHTAEKPSKQHWSTKCSCGFLHPLHHPFALCANTEACSFCNEGWSHWRESCGFRWECSAFASTSAMHCGLGSCNCPMLMTSRFLDLGLWLPGACNYAWKRTWKASRSTIVMIVSYYAVMISYGSESLDWLWFCAGHLFRLNQQLLLATEQLWQVSDTQWMLYWIHVVLGLGQAKFG